MVVASLRPRGGDILSTRQNRRREPFGRPTHQQSQRDPDAMDVDVATVGKGMDHCNDGLCVELGNESRDAGIALIC